MQKLNNLLVIFFIIFLQSNLIYSLDKNEVYNKLKSQYNDLQTISLEFKSDGKYSQTTFFTAKRGNKYRISTNDREIFCNSTTIWNYSVRDKNVIISNVKSSKSPSLEQIFFDFAKNYQPIKFTKNHTSKGKNSSVLELEAKDNRSEQYNQINLILNDIFQIIGIELVKNYKSEKYSVSNIKLNEKLDDKYFEFNKNDKIEIIDLR
ncbi:MAG TPA: outer-membrane lipoprotein carrier protein LolA [Candidatus Kapabacteria bacterium]|nr:outer-membrane lipoprotein carrier protein LolA [Candidatus Kapabacteria bacterium]